MGLISGDVSPNSNNESLSRFFSYLNHLLISDSFVFILNGNGTGNPEPIRPGEGVLLGVYCYPTAMNRREITSRKKLSCTLKKFKTPSEYKLFSHPASCIWTNSHANVRKSVVGKPCKRAVTHAARQPHRESLPIIFFYYTGIYIS